MRAWRRRRGSHEPLAGKTEKTPDDELTKLTKEGSVSSVSAPTGAFEEKSVPGNRWLAELNKAPRHLEEVPPAPRPPVAEQSPLTSVMTSEPAVTKGASAPLQEIERIIEVLAREVGRDLGRDLENLMRRAMKPLDHGTRAALAVEIDDAFEAAQNIGKARKQAAHAIHRRLRLGVGGDSAQSHSDNGSPISSISAAPDRPASQQS